MFTLADQGKIPFEFPDALYLIYPDYDARIAFSCPRFPSENRINLNPIQVKIRSTGFAKIAEYINDKVEESNVL